MSGVAPRTAWVDALRGVAVVWMIGYHFCFDLNWYGWARWQMLADPFWTVQRASIVSLFMFTAGLSQALAWRGGQTAAAFWRRWAQVAGCAVLVSASSYVSFPQTWIYFGVLHAFALMWLLTRALKSLSLGPWAWAVLGVLIWSSAWWVPAGLHDAAWQTWFNAPPGNVLGWVSHKPHTEDYAPLAPWWGVMLLGVAVGAWWWSRERSAWSGWRGEGALSRVVRFMGRHSLLVYMLHQPLMLAGFELAEVLAAV